MNSISITFHKDEEIYQDILKRLLSVDELFESELDKTGNNYCLYLSLNDDIKEPQLLGFFDYLKELALKNRVETILSRIKFKQNNLMINYGCYFDKIKFNERFLDYPDPNKISADIVERINDKVFIVYKTQLKDLSSTKRLGYQDIKVDLLNGDYSLSVQGKLSMYNIDDKKYTVAVTSRGLDSWPGIYLGIDSDDIDIIKDVIRKEYQKKGYKVKDIKITKNDQ